ncbi:MAG: methyltransferase domain-containing protein [Deltaproteobacteria bacterium]|nr:methyltransferase domain-containing protein [Deltaproteobacteria bacterium]
MPTPTFATHELEEAVRETYGAAARAPAGLCCPTTGDPGLLGAVPAEILERDYGCGDPTRHVRPGETVLDLGSGAGKAGYLLSQIVGPAGRVVGVDMNDEMLALSRRHLAAFAERTGLANLAFRKGRIQDLGLDLEAVDRWLQAHPVRSSEDLARVEAESARLRVEAPLVPDGSVDVVVSDCVLNLVRPEDKARLFREIHRVLRKGGRAVISDIVSDEDVPEALQRDPELWAGCISGAMREDRFLQAFEEAGLYGVTLLERPERPWRTVEGIEFRSVTAVAYRGKEGPCWDRKQAVIYRGPFREVTDDDGHVLRRGVRVAVCDKTFGLYSRAPYRDHLAFVEPLEPVPLEAARPFPCGAAMLVRDPAETKGGDHEVTTEPAAACAGGGCC